MTWIRESELGDLVARHHQSLPHYEEGDDIRPWPWLGLFYVIPFLATTGLAMLGLAPSRTLAVSLLAGVGVLGGLLFQVLAWVSGRISALADSTNVEAPEPAEVDLVARLDIARANIAYASLVSLVFVTQLGIASLLKDPPNWMAWVSTFLMLHFVLTLLLMLVRINSIGKTDRVVALTRHARRRSGSAAP